MMETGDSMKATESTEQKQKRLAAERQEMAEFVIDQRLSVDWTPADLARNAGIDTGNLSKLESGQRGADGITITRIVKAVNEEKERRLHKASFLNEKERQYCNMVTDITIDMNRSGFSQPKIDGVRESMNGIIKGVLAP